MCDIKGVLLHMLCAIDRAHNNYHNMIIITVLVLKYIWPIGALTMWTFAL